jgi:pimeloyl-ACP methyl ester carboxylesterase
MGSQLRRPDGTDVWLNAGNALGYHDLRLPALLPLRESRDDLEPGGLIGVDTVLPRLFGFTEYADLLELFDLAGFHRDSRREGGRGGAVYHVFTYDWRRDLVESARRLDAELDALAVERGDEDARFNLIGHSMGGLLARYYLRYGTAEPGGPVTWAGARRVESLFLVATPNGGSIPALEAILNGNRVGLSSTTLSVPVIAHMPSIYQLLPGRGTRPLVDGAGETLDVDLTDPASWDRFGWGAWRPSPNGDAERGERHIVAALLQRAAAFHAALGLAPARPCPVRVVALGGDTLPTLARAVAPDKRGGMPRFEPWSRREGDLLLEAGDGRVTRASVLASHLPGSQRSVFGSGIPEVSHAFFGEADHHGIYAEPTFQSLLLRLLLQPAPAAEAVP